MTNLILCCHPVGIWISQSQYTIFRFTLKRRKRSGSVFPDDDPSAGLQPRVGIYLLTAGKADSEVHGGFETPPRQHHFARDGVRQADFIRFQREPW